MIFHKRELPVLFSASPRLRASALKIGLTAILFPLLITATPIEEGNQSYQRGEQATTLLEREQAFNQALTLYTTAASQIPAPSQELYQAIANTFYQLGEYPWAILYNYKALKLNPTNPDLINHIQHSRDLQGLDTPFAPYTRWQQILLQPYLSLGQLITTLLALTILSFVSLPLLIWFPRPILKTLSTLLSAVTLFLFLTVILNHYFTPTEGILVTSTGYYRAPDLQQAQLITKPLKAGTKMRILNIEKNGEWTKTADENGLIGYVPSSAIRVV